MKSSIRVSRGGRTITFRGAAARACFEAMSGTKLPAAEAPRTDPKCGRCKGTGEYRSDVETGLVRCGCVPAE